MIARLLCWLGMHEDVKHFSLARKKGADNSSPLTIQHDAVTSMCDGFYCVRCGRPVLDRNALPKGWSWERRQTDDWREWIENYVKEKP